VLLLSNHQELGRSTVDDGLVIVGDPSVACTLCWWKLQYVGHCSVSSYEEGLIPFSCCFEYYIHVQDLSSEVELKCYFDHYQN